MHWRNLRFGKMQHPCYTRRDDRGIFHELMNQGRWESLIYGVMRRGSEMGHHSHRATVVFLYLLRGRARVTTRNRRTGRRSTALLGPGQGYLFRPEEVRVIKYLAPTAFVMLKSRRYDPARPDLIPEQDATRRVR